ncbi:MAG TPA: hypothetical protein VNY05_35845 [Candidatus Acidoferrales bacterium]|jgi:hypothetical protein|nr:hypothetical protein [Candidatus Acidoferrales bacterium]
MILHCSDLDRALSTPDLMPEMRAHAQQCEACAWQLHVWSEISRVAPELHREWESPLLWQRIAAGLLAEKQAAEKRAVETRLSKAMPAWRWALCTAAVALLAVALFQPWRSWRPRANQPRANQPAGDLMTEAALQEVRQTEVAYVRSIAKLAALAASGLQQSPSPLAAAYREKLLLLDSAIADLQANVENNRYNTYLETELAGLYRAKQKTLQDWIQNANRN